MRNDIWLPFKDRTVSVFATFLRDWKSKKEASIEYDPKYFELVPKKKAPKYWNHPTVIRAFNKFDSFDIIEGKLVEKDVKKKNFLKSYKLKSYRYRIDFPKLLYKYINYRLNLPSYPVKMGNMKPNPEAVQRTKGNFKKYGLIQLRDLIDEEIRAFFVKQYSGDSIEGFLQQIINVIFIYWETFPTQNNIEKLKSKKINYESFLSLVPEAKPVLDETLRHADYYTRIRGKIFAKITNAMSTEEKRVEKPLGSVLKDLISPYMIPLLWAT